LPAPIPAPPGHVASVRTETPPFLVGSPCPVCKERLLRGRQTVCCGRCRAKRWRETRTARDPEIRAALEAIAGLVQVTFGRLVKEARHDRHHRAIEAIAAYIVMLWLARWVKRRRSHEHTHAIS